MGKKGEKKKSGDVKRQEGVSVDDMGSKSQYRPVLLALIVVIFSVSVSAVRSELVWSRHSRKTAALKMDEASLTVLNEIQSNLTLSVLSDLCYQCLPQLVGNVTSVSGPGNVSAVIFTVSTQHVLTLQLNSTPANIELCRVQFHFGEQGNYSLWVKNLSDSDHINCSIFTVTEPINSYLPLLIASVVCVAVCVLSAVWSSVMRLNFVRNLVLRVGSSMEAERLINSDLGSPSRITESSESIAPPTSGRRLQSLDTFRGFALVIMVFVNYGGGRYWFFRHQSWNGLTVADLVFPWFVFIMGTSVSLSLSGSLSRGLRRSRLLMRICWRSLLLFIIGVFIINPSYCSGPLSWETLRIPGVLQRLAFTYLIVAILDVSTAGARLGGSSPNAWWFPVHDVVLYWPAWVCVLMLEALWLCVTFLLPVPACPSGYLGPGGIGDFGLYPNCTGGAAGYIDRWLLGENHIYQTPSSRLVYQTTVPYDPEGVLGSINSILMAFLGLQAGKILQHYRDNPRQIMTRFLVWGFVLGIISAVLTKCSRDHGFIPVNKNLWSLSYVTTLSCFAFVLLMVCYYTVDVKKWWSGAPFVYPGMNSILVYVGHEVFEDYFPFRWKMRNSQSHVEHLTQNLLAMCVWMLISYILYRKKIFWKI
ncbi:heparan-alpha-glucosaminide N-acetyltransferase [Ictalurus punctatus]|uniref:Heparan-alpha-glucosaminide N-acetyltransferase n=1 Tax=Ictalurus punctatus TaxID=7998 RepID=A0A9F7R589_ICTPU|nr:heparan-alpha-glucosaminide N-acetyltransferase [Ictalurus punctatus]